MIGNMFYLVLDWFFQRKVAKPQRIVNIFSAPLRLGVRSDLNLGRHYFDRSKDADTLANGLEEGHKKRVRPVRTR
jgi:hypothetical protein